MILWKYTKDYIDTRIINSTESFTDVKNSATCSLEYSISGERRPCFIPVVSDCPATCQNQNLISLCEAGYQSLTVGYQSLEVKQCTEMPIVLLVML